uniref:Putative septum site-determining protein MinD n=1 Tax=Stygiella incarcerata TaxID=1712417 RepID=A0A0E3SU89_9EUKA|nr:mitochondrial MinD [Stygiella incarcerata]
MLRFQMIRSWWGKSVSHASCLFSRFLSGKTIVVTSGKGGVGKTTTVASMSYGLAERGHKVCAVDFDIGLRNLDLHLGMERRVVFDFVHVIHGDCKLHQALIKDRRNPNLSLLAASQTRDKTALTVEGVEKVLDELREQFDYIVCDSPAGIEHGAYQAMYFADEAIICTNPELSSVRDSDKMIGLISSRSKRAELNASPTRCMLLLTRYQPEKVREGTMISVDDIAEMLGIPLIGVIPETSEVLEATNIGDPVIMGSPDKPGAGSYRDFVARYLGEDVSFRFLEPAKRGIFARLFGK